MRERAFVLPFLFLALLLGSYSIAAVPTSEQQADKTGKEPLPFTFKIETFRNKEGDVSVFCVRLEQSFLAEEFEKSNFLRIQALDRNAYLVYPTETKFQQKHAEFYGRLRGEGKAHLRITYEMITENLDGSRRIVTRQGDIEVMIPSKEGGTASIYREWAQRQNAYFLEQLRYYPHETFFQYALLQSRERYGVVPPELPRLTQADPELESNLYGVFTGSQAIQEALQRYTLKGSTKTGGALNTHISQLSPPTLQSLPYEELLAAKGKKNIQPKPHEIAKLVPEDQYFLHFHSMKAAGEMSDLMSDWGDSLLRLVTIRVRDNRLQEKLERQLGIERTPLTRLFEEGVVSEMAITGGDPFVVEGTDIAVILHLKKPEHFQGASDAWLTATRARHPKLEERSFNYRGQQIQARYTDDRLASSFVVRLGDYVVYANSHRGVRKVVDAFAGQVPRLFDALDCRYVTTFLPPLDDARSGYLFASEAFLKRMISPEARIAEKRRLQCFNNLVMLNNASLLYRMENDKSPASTSDLIEGRYIDANKLVCPHGGAYSWDSHHDTCTCSLHNRLKYLTPIAELGVLQVSEKEHQEYDAYKQNYESFWKGVYDPIAMRFIVGQQVKLEVCVLPFANGSVYHDLRGWVSDKPQQLRTANFAPSALASFVAVRGRKEIGSLLRQVPGMTETLDADPTLTDLSWIGDRLALHFCDDDSIVEIDPTRLKSISLFGGFSPTLGQQGIAAIAFTAMKMPVYATINVEDKDKAARLLEQLASRVFLKQGSYLGLPTELDAYRVPDYKGHTLYVLSFQLYAVKVRLHIALVGDQLVAATKPKVLCEVIDASSAKDQRPPAEAHLLLRLNRKALNRFQHDLELFWEEKARHACHDNIMSIYTLLKLYSAPMEEVNHLAETKYGVTYHCPDGGTYHYDAKHDQVECSVHGNRPHSRQGLALSAEGSFSRFFNSLEEIQASVRFEEDHLITTVEIIRSPPPAK